MPQSETTLKRLRALPQEEQRTVALRLLATEKSITLLSAALHMLEGHPLPAQACSVLVQCYQRIATHHQKMDLDGALRARILTLLGSDADRNLLEEALTTYEFSYGHSEVAGGLRATALVQLDRSTPDDAAWYATKLLHDVYTSPMSGEPALTAARVLASQGTFLPLYGYALSASPVIGEVIAECMKAFTSLSHRLLAPLIERYRHATDATIIAALVDLLLSHTERDAFADTIAAIIAETEDSALYQFIATSLLTSGSSRYHTMLLDMATYPLAPEYRDALAEVYALRPDDPQFVQALACLA